MQSTLMTSGDLIFINANHFSVRLCSVDLQKNHNKSETLAVLKAKFTRKMGQESYRLATLGMCTIACVLSLATIALTIGSLSWQGLIVYYPQYKSGENVSCIFQVSRREGFFHTCYTRLPGDHNINRLGLKCRQNDYGKPSNFAGWRDSAYYELITWRRLALTAIIFAVSFALVGLILTAFFLKNWMKIESPEEFQTYQRLVAAILFLSSGLLYQLGTIFLHIFYLRGSVLQTKHLPLISTSWAEHMQTATAVSYSHAYHMLIVATYFVEIAGLLVISTALFARFLFDEPSEETEEDNIRSAFTYKVTLPRYATDDMDYDEKTEGSEGRLVKRRPDSSNSDQ
ncbi:unnamed protein product [Dicrocoelium dendriticum]|nr:unnamed protein product [Dicrocoelium dendriticum]